MSELTKRIAVAAVVIPLVLGLVFVGGWYLAIPLSAFAALGALELYRLAARGGITPHSSLGASGTAGLVLLAAWQPTLRGFAPWAVALLGALTASALVLAIFARGPEKEPLSTTAVTLFGAVYVGLSLSVVPLLHSLPVLRGWAPDGGDRWSGALVIALPLATTWVGDSCAYFAGTAWGKSKLAPSISPQKSWVGLWADLVGAGAAAAVWFVIVHSRLPGLSLGFGVTVGIGVLLGLGAVAGDLVESLLKREAGVKDSGTFFPGHGGVLDRLDALIFTLPLAYVVLALLGGGG